ncbi:hypothetical protein H5410_052507 [Solanum commersonii]|uniref:Uncharacterized protein n=1 Tax=Solanum commersonii TaxID=4109 RepID=A0A9J5X4A8_SOLCO|nr:hypothetical protein H5410_052507 [Solanum commersonii]
MRHKGVLVVVDSYPRLVSFDDAMGLGGGYHKTKDLNFQRDSIRTLICPRFNIEIISEVFPDFVLSTNNSKYLDSFRTGPSQIAMIRSTFYTISETQGLNRMDM